MNEHHRPDEDSRPAYPKDSQYEIADDEGRKYAIRSAGSDDDDDDAYDDLEDDDVEDATGVCKFGGPAPCIDDICHAIGGCMGWQDYQP